MTINGQQALAPFARSLSTSTASSAAFIVPGLSSGQASTGRLKNMGVASSNHLGRYDLTSTPSSLRQVPSAGLKNGLGIRNGLFALSRPSGFSSALNDVEPSEHSLSFGLPTGSHETAIKPQDQDADDCNFGEHDLVNELDLRGHDAPHTKIIATLGPETSSVPMLKKMIEAGMNVARINCAHASEADIQCLTNNVKTASQLAKIPVLVLVDVKGPDLRTTQIQQMPAPDRKPIKDQTLKVKAGDSVDFTPKPDMPILDDVPTVSVNYPSITKLEVGKPLSIDGLLNFEIVAQAQDRVRARALGDGEISLKRHVNLPGTHVELPALTKKDYMDVKAAQAAGAACLALSFVRTADDLRALRAYTQKLEAEGVGPAPMLVAKIEDRSGVDNIQEIAEEADGVMIARGDLAVEVPISEVSILQRHIAEVCHKVGTPCILATEILESMADSPSPTRAELADMGRAVTYESVDAVMLSRETAMGKYPLESIRTMRDAVKASEKVDSAHYWPEPELDSTASKWLRSVADFAKTIQSPKSLVLFTERLDTAQMLSAMRIDNMPFYVFTTQPRVAAQLTLNWGTQPVLLKEPEDCDGQIDPDEGVRRSVEYLKQHDLVTPGEQMVTLSDASLDQLLRTAP